MPTGRTCTATKFLLVLLFVLLHDALQIESLHRWVSLRVSMVNSVKFHVFDHPLRRRPMRLLASFTSRFLCNQTKSNRICPTRTTKIHVRGGSDENDDQSPDNITLISSTDHNSAAVQKEMSVSRNRPRIRRHTSDVMWDLNHGSIHQFSTSFHDESLALRDLISSRTQDYLYELREAVAANDKKLPHPRKLLHYLAPKVPAIRQSPDVNLRVHSSRSDIDPGIAACIIATLARVCEVYDKEMAVRVSNVGTEQDKSLDEQPKSVATDITTDRRFEQLVECVISGVNVPKRKAEFFQRQLDNSSEEAADIEEILEEEESKIDEGLSIRDACRAAWGISILGAHYLDTMGGVKVTDLLLALALRIRELLLARLQLLRQDDILNYDSVQNGSPITRTTGECLVEISAELATDAATAMWAFACVRACTGMRSPLLFEACSSLLCQDPVDLRKRAQERANYRPGNPTIGSSDVIDQLARSEITETGSKANALKVPTVDEDKDVLLSWLSPTEVNDVLWALALHGSNATSPDEEISLSETATTLRETAYDRMVEWLGSDLKRLQLSDRQITVETSFETVSQMSNSNCAKLEVANAAAVLKTRESPISSSISAVAHTVPVENLTLQSNTLVSHDGSIHEVEVVDAATLLASASCLEEIAVETEGTSAPVSVLKSNEIVFADEDRARKSFESDIGNSCDEPIFTPHDLASIAWSVTELKDPLVGTVVGMIIELFARLGPASISLSGGDLSNLAWAIAKNQKSSLDDQRIMILQWIADHISQRMQRTGILGTFQPPEIGRVTWAMASVFSTHSSIGFPIRESQLIVAQRALRAAAENLSFFSTEDLVRISWAVLELTHSNLAGLDPLDVSALGRILATTDMSLQRWEKGECGAETQVSGSHNEASLFSSFFGRPRLNLPILELVMGGEGDDEDGVLTSFPEKSRRPKLKDLSVDPSTLCKASCNFQRLSASHRYIRGGWTMTRIAVRLLSSKNGRLMRECSIHDIVRICEAAVLSEVDGHGRELILGLFARQVIALLNTAFEDETKRGCAVEIKAASSSEIATLIWALGELGVKVTLNGEEDHSATKKMRLSSVEPLTSNLEVDSLELAPLLRLIRGLTLIKASPAKGLLFHQALTRIKELVPYATTQELCLVAENVGLFSQFASGQITGVMGDHADGLSKSDEFDSREMNSSESERSRNDEENNSAGTVEELLQLSNTILSSVAQAASARASALSAEEIRRLLEVYSLLPFEADLLVDSLSTVVRDRISRIEDLARNQSLDTLLTEAREHASFVKSTLYEETDKSFFSSIKHGFMSFFGSNDDERTEDDVPDEGEILTRQIASMIEGSIAATTRAVDQAQSEEHLLQVSIDDVLSAMHENALFELGRSLELIENYRRIEFSSGKQRSRYDKDRRNEIAKRVLSRLFP